MSMKNPLTIAGIIQGVPKVGIQYITNYCILTVYLLLAHPVCTYVLAHICRPLSILKTTP